MGRREEEGRAREKHTRKVQEIYLLTLDKEMTAGARRVRKEMAGNTGIGWV